MSERQRPQPPEPDPRIHQLARASIDFELTPDRRNKHRRADQELAELTGQDPAAAQIIRVLTERYFPGAQDMHLKEKMTLALLDFITAYRRTWIDGMPTMQEMLSDMDELVRHFGVTENESGES